MKRGSTSLGPASAVGWSGNVLPAVLVLLMLATPASASARDAAPLEAASGAPRIAVALSHETIALSSYVPQRTAYGWLGVAALAGIPYETVFVDDLEGDGARLAARYDAIVLPELHALGAPVYDRLARLLREYRAAGGNVVVDGPAGVMDEAGAWRGDGPLLETLACAVPEYVSFDSLSIVIAPGAKNAHVVTEGWEAGARVTPPLAYGHSSLAPRDGAGVTLLESRAPGGATFPWLVCSDDGPGRVVLIGGAFGAGDAASIFRSERARMPDVPNRLYEILTAALQWAVYGDDTGPVPALQFSAADAAVLIRLDGDHSNHPEDVVAAFTYLLDTGRESGVGTAYGIVSERAAVTGWPLFATLAKRLEELGGEIGTHTHRHDIYGHVDSAIARREIDESVDAIERDLTAAGYDPDGVPFLINPNGMIPMTAYGEIAGRVPLYFTHGISTPVPVAYGVSTWFSRSPLVVIYDSPEPDFQWLYDRGWNFTADEAGRIQSALFDHYVSVIRRGVLFDMMWHDYGIATTGYAQSRSDFRWADLFRPARRKSVSNLPLFDALRTRFARARIYCPEPLEAADKLRVLQGASYEWTRRADGLAVTLDLSAAGDAAARATAGMGLRIDRARGPIRSVSINGRPHPAFRTVDRRNGGGASPSASNPPGNVVLLPALHPGRNTIDVTFGPAPDVHRLTYVSKPLLSVEHEPAGGRLAFELGGEGLARFEVLGHGANPWVTRADSFRVAAGGSSDSGRVITGYGWEGGRFDVAHAPPGFPRLRSSNGPLIACERGGSNERFLITIGARPVEEAVLRFEHEGPLLLTGSDGVAHRSVPEAAGVQRITVPRSMRETRFVLTTGGAP